MSNKELFKKLDELLDIIAKSEKYINIYQLTRIGEKYHDKENLLILLINKLESDNLLLKGRIINSEGLVKENEHSYKLNANGILLHGRGGFLKDDEKSNRESRDKNIRTKLATTATVINAVMIISISIIGLCISYEKDTYEKEIKKLNSKIDSLSSSKPLKGFPIGILIYTIRNKSVNNKTTDKATNKPNSEK